MGKSAVKLFNLPSMFNSEAAWEKSMRKTKSLQAA
jgi:hypothetical protein